MRRAGVLLGVFFIASARCSVFIKRSEPRQAIIQRIISRTNMAFSEYDDAIETSRLIERVGVSHFDVAAIANDHLVSRQGIPSGAEAIFVFDPIRVPRSRAKPDQGVAALAPEIDTWGENTADVKGEFGGAIHDRIAVPESRVNRSKVLVASPGPSLPGVRPKDSLNGAVRFWAVV